MSLLQMLTSKNEQKTYQIAFYLFSWWKTSTDVNVPNDYILWWTWNDLGCLIFVSQCLPTYVSVFEVPFMFCCWCNEMSSENKILSLFTLPQKRKWGFFTIKQTQNNEHLIELGYNWEIVVTVMQNLILSMSVSKIIELIIDNNIMRFGSSDV